jgi:tetratricopeptide (TPR) repeat protein
MSIFNDQRPMLSGANLARLCAVGLILLLLGGFFYFLATLGPSQIDNSIRRLAADHPEMVALKERSVTLERDFERALEFRPAGSGDLAQLREAIEAQRQFLRQARTSTWEDSERLQKLETRLASIEAETLQRESERREQQAEALIKEGKKEEALAEFQESLRLQRAINGSAAAGQLRNAVRETALGMQVDGLLAEPLNEQMVAFEARGRESLAAMRVVEAGEAFAAALELQRQINRDYGRTRYADFSRVDRLESEIASLNTGGLIQEIQGLLADARTAEDIGESQRAGVLFGMALEKQREINVKFPRSRFVSSSRLDELEGMRQSALSRVEALAIAAAVEQLTIHLRGRRVEQARGLLEPSVRKFDELVERFPRSRYLTPEARSSLNYLMLMQGEIGAIQDRFYAMAEPMPGN